MEIQEWKPFVSPDLLAPESHAAETGTFECFRPDFKLLHCDFNIEKAQFRAFSSRFKHLTVESPGFLPKVLTL